MSDQQAFFDRITESRAKLKAAYEQWPEGDDKDAVKYYIDYYDAVDTATPETVAKIIGDLMMSADGNERYMAGMKALARGPY